MPVSVTASKVSIEIDFSQIIAKQLDILGSQIKLNIFTVSIIILKSTNLNTIISYKFKIEDINKAIEIGFDILFTSKAMIEM